MILIRSALSLACGFITFAVVPAAAQTAEAVPAATATPIPEVTVKGFIPDWKTSQIFWDADKVSKAEKDVRTSASASRKSMELKPLQIARKDEESEKEAVESARKAEASKKYSKEKKTTAQSDSSEKKDEKKDGDSGSRSESRLSKLGSDRDESDKKPASGSRAVASADKDESKSSDSSKRKATQTESSESAKKAAKAKQEDSDDDLVVVSLDDGLTAKVSRETASAAGPSRPSYLRDESRRADAERERAEREAGEGGVEVFDRDGRRLRTSEDSRNDGELSVVEGQVVSVMAGPHGALRMAISMNGRVVQAVATPGIVRGIPAQGATIRLRGKQLTGSRTRPVFDVAEVEACSRMLDRIPRPMVAESIPPPVYMAPPPGPSFWSHRAH